MSGGRLGSLLAIAWVGSSVLPACGGAAFTTGGVSGVDAGPATQDAQPVAASTDAATGSDAGAGWCATQSATHTFCEDFLHGVPDKLVGLSANAMLVPDVIDFESAPQSMAAITPALPKKGDAAAALATHDFSGATGTQFVLASYFKVASSCFPGNGGFDPVSIAILEFPEQGYGLAIDATPSGVALVEVTLGPDGGVTDTPQVTTFDSPALLDTWKLWTLTINGGIGKSITLTVGGAQVIPSRPLKNAPPIALLQHPALLLGASVKNDQGLSPGCRVNVDDILFDAKSAATTAN
jgi:hypothetical protein